MKVALIPPRGLEHMALLSDFHLTLAQILTTDYLRTYGIADKRRDFIVMDNGAAEGMAITSASRLLVIASRYGADEVVVPDHLGDADATRDMIKEFFDAEKMISPAYRKFDYMCVVQGNHVIERHNLIAWLAPQLQVKTIGIPRKLIGDGTLGVRIDLANWIESTFPGRFQIHFLGASPLWPRELQSVAKYAPHVRSLDSSMPFAYAMSGVRLKDKHLPKIARPEGYFDFPVDCYDLAYENCMTMLEWANAQAPVG